MGQKLQVDYTGLNTVITKMKNTGQQCTGKKWHDLSKNILKIAKIISS